MFFELEEAERPSKLTFEQGLCALLLLVSGLWFYLFQVYPLVQEQSSKHTFKVSITHTKPIENNSPSDLEKIEEQKELDSPAPEIDSLPTQAYPAMDIPLPPTEKTKAPAEPINIRSLVEEIVKSHSKSTNEEQAPNSAVFSPSMRKAIDDAKSNRPKTKEESGLPFSDGRNHYTNIHDQLYVQSENGCRFRQKMVPDTDGEAVWFFAGCNEPGMKFEYKSELPAYPGFEHIEQQRE